MKNVIMDKNKKKRLEEFLGKTLEDWEKERIKNIENCYSTQGYKKLWNYFLEIVKSDYFQKRMRALRTLYHIPAEGFKHKSIHSTPPDEWDY